MNVHIVCIYACACVYVFIVLSVLFIDRCTVMYMSKNQEGKREIVGVKKKSKRGALDSDLGLKLN